MNFFHLSKLKKNRKEKLDGKNQGEFGLLGVKYFLSKTQWEWVRGKCMQLISKHQST